MSDRRIEELLGQALPELPCRPDAAARILKQIACKVEDDTVLGFLDGSLEGRALASYKSHREGCALCTSRESTHEDVWTLLAEALPEFASSAQSIKRTVRAAVQGEGQRAAALKIGPMLHSGAWLLRFAAALLVTTGVVWLLMRSDGESEIAQRSPPITERQERLLSPVRIELPRERGQAPLAAPNKAQQRPSLVPVGSEPLIPKVVELAQQPKVQRELPPEGVRHEPPVQDPTPEAPQQEAQLARKLGLEESDIVLAQDLELLENFDAALEYELVMNMDVLALLTIEDLE